MMKIIFLTFMLSALFIGTAIAQEYTFDGEIDPGVFKDWTVLADHSERRGAYVYICLLNPDKVAEIQVAIIAVNGITTDLEVYGYLKGDDVRFFSFDGARYVEYFPKQEDMKATKRKMKEILESIRGKKI